MWTNASRQRAWSDLDQEWDLVVIGGGITGAGIFAAAARRGLKVALFEANDFAFGTSSRSSKLVHGGLRYLRQAQIRLTRASVKEREELLRGAEGLVNPLGFYVANYEGDKTPPWMFGLGLAVYDVLARKWAHTKLQAEELLEALPMLKGSSPLGGYHFSDAQTDDTRLVMRVLSEGQRYGGKAFNYTPVTSLLKDHQGNVRGVAVEERVGEGSRTAEVRAKAVVNATGAWGDRLRQTLGRTPRLRAIRGSHLVFPHKVLPVPQGVSLLHPTDGRAVFIIPWLGSTLVGTTDVDHGVGLDKEPAISAKEIDYLLDLTNHACPGLKLTLDDAIGTYAGVRPVVGTGAADPSKESRDHALWLENGMLTVAGGKLTTFRLIAREALRELSEQLPEARNKADTAPILDEVARAVDHLAPLDQKPRHRLLGRYGTDAALVYHSSPRQCVPVTDELATLWSEVRWAARSEGVVHLDDLMLRRVRLGMLLANGGQDLLPRVRPIVQDELGWSDELWEEEAARYGKIWKDAYAPSPTGV